MSQGAARPLVPKGVAVSEELRGIAAAVPATGTKLFEPVNLDDLSVDPDDLSAAATLFFMLAVYAENKAFAMRLRRDGEAAAVAAAVEAKLELLYGMLPAWSRWSRW